MSPQWIEGLVLASGVMLVAGGFSNSDFTGYLLVLLGYALVLASVWVRDWERFKNRFK